MSSHIPSRAKARNADGKFPHFPAPPQRRRCFLQLIRHSGESVIQKLTDESKSLVGSSKASHALKEAVKHALPYLEASIHSRSDGALDEADRIVKQYLVVTDMHENGG